MQDTLQRLNGNKINLKVNALEVPSSASFDLMAIQCYAFARRFMLENGFTDEFFDLTESIQRNGQVKPEFYEFLTGWMARKSLSALLTDRMFEDPKFSPKTFDYRMLSSQDWKITALPNETFMANRVVYLSDSIEAGEDKKAGFGETPLAALRQAMAQCGYLVEPITHEVRLDERQTGQYLTKTQVLRVLDYDEDHRTSFKFGVRGHDETVSDMLNVLSYVGCRTPQTVLTHNLEARQRFLQISSLSVGKKMGLDTHNLRHFMGWLAASEHQDRLQTSFELLKEYDLVHQCSHKAIQDMIAVGVIGLSKQVDEEKVRWGCTSFTNGHESVGWIYAHTPAQAYLKLHDAIAAYRSTLR